jgi:hypothetical protein
VRPPRQGLFWRLGGPLTDENEAEAKAAEAARTPGPIGRTVLKVLGGRGKPRA